MADYIGSSGTLIGAALETAGYYYQSYVLDALSQPFAGGPNALNSAGAFLYIVGAMVAMGTMVARGNYKLGLWFFLGPGLFFGSVLPRSETAGSDWVFGGEPRDREQLHQQVEEELQHEAYSPHVSNLFAWYNNLVSRSVREIVRVLNGERKDLDFRFLIRAQLYSDMISPVVQEPGFQLLLHHGFLGQCRNVINLAREVADPANDHPVDDANAPNGLGNRRQQLIQEYRKAAEADVYRLHETEIGYILSLYRYYPDLFKEGNSLTNNINTEVANLQSGCHINRTNTCHAAPQPIMQGLDQIKQKNQERANEIFQRLRSGAPESISLDDPRIKDDPRMLADLAAFLQAHGTTIDEVKKLKEIRAELTNGLTCHEIWNFIYAGLHRYASLEFDRLKKEAISKLVSDPKEKEEAEAEWEKVRPHFADMMNVSKDANADEMVRGIAKRIFRNEVNRGSIGGLISAYVDKGERVSEIGLPSEGELSLTERTRTANREWTERTRMMVSAATLPYYQGIALYFLSIAFPFFAMLLLVPGKHSGFLLWFGLWFWVKSWDIGFAITMLLDDVLHTLFVQHPKIGYEGALSKLDQDLSVAIFSLREVDPAFNLSTYYSIIATAIHGIPIIFSHLILGSVTGGAGLIAAGMDRYVNGSFGSGTATAGAAKMAQSQFGINAFRGQFNQDKLEAVSNSISGDQGQRPGMARGMGTRAEQENPLSGERTGLSRSGGFLGMGQNAQGWGVIGLSGFVGFTRGLKSDAFANTIDESVRDISHASLKNAKETAMAAARAARDREAIKAAKGIKTRIPDGKWDTSERIDTMLDVAGSIAGQAKGSLRTFYQNRLNLLTQWASYDSVNSSRSQSYAAHARRMDMFEIPWTEDGGWEAEVDYELDQWKQTVKMAQTLLAAGNKVVQNEFRIKNEGRRKSEERAAKRDMMQELSDKHGRRKKVDRDGNPVLNRNGEAVDEPWEDFKKGVSKRRKYEARDRREVRNENNRDRRGDRRRNRRGNRRDDGNGGDGNDTNGNDGGNNDGGNNGGGNNGGQQPPDQHTSNTGNKRNGPDFSPGGVLGNVGLPDLSGGSPSVGYGTPHYASGTPNYQPGGNPNYGPLGDPNFGELADRPYRSAVQARDQAQFAQKPDLHGDGPQIKKDSHYSSLSGLIADARNHGVSDLSEEETVLASDNSDEHDYKEAISKLRGKISKVGQA